MNKVLNSIGCSEFWHGGETVYNINQEIWQMVGPLLMTDSLWMCMWRIIEWDRWSEVIVWDLSALVSSINFLLEIKNLEYILSYRIYGLTMNVPVGPWENHLILNYYSNKLCGPWENVLAMNRAVLSNSGYSETEFVKSLLFYGTLFSIKWYVKQMLKWDYSAVS